MSQSSIAFAGMDRADEEEIRPIFDRANAAIGGAFQIGSEDSADVLVVDVDSIHGHMTWIRMQNDHERTVVAVSARQAPHAEHCLVRPVTVEAFTEVLASIAGGQEAEAPAPVEAPATTPEPPVVAESEPAVATTPAAAPVEPPQPPARKRLGDYLVPGALPGPSRLSLPGAPELLVDPVARSYVGPAQLKGFAAYAQAEEITPEQWQPIGTDVLAASPGTPQPWARLAWLSGLYRSPGELAPGLALEDHFALLKWPQIEREFPRHFRIATSMMKAPATAAEIAEASGAPLEEVVDFINASLAAGQADRVVEEPVPEDVPTKAGSFLGRLKGLRGN